MISQKDLKNSLFGEGLYKGTPSQQKKLTYYSHLLAPGAPFSKRWNWSAAFFGFIWGMYRRVCGIPLSLVMLGGYFFYFLSLSHWFWGLLWIEWYSFRISTLSLFLVFLFVPFLVWGYWGNRWYIRSLNKKLAAKRDLKGPRLSLTFAVIFLFILSTSLAIGMGLLMASMVYSNPEEFPPLSYESDSHDQSKAFQ